MIAHPVQQNSENWETLRLGIPTASEMHKIVCPSMGKQYECPDCGKIFPRRRTYCDCCEATICVRAIVKPSAQQDEYMYKLIAESFLRRPLSKEPNGWMERGHEMEPQAVREYEFLTGRDTMEAGFYTTDDGLLGASPDRLVEGGGLLEAKGPSPWVHMRHLATGDLADDHKVQLQAQLMVTGAEFVDVISYHPELPTIIIRVERDEAFIGGMNEILVSFVEKLHRTRAELMAKYSELRTKVEDLGASQEDVDVIIRGRR